MTVRRKLELIGKCSAAAVPGLGAYVKRKERDRFYKIAGLETPNNIKENDGMIELFKDAGAGFGGTGASSMICGNGEYGILTIIGLLYGLSVGTDALEIGSYVSTRHAWEDATPEKKRKMEHNIREDTEKQLRELEKKRFESCCDTIDDFDF